MTAMYDLAFTNYKVKKRSLVISLSRAYLFFRFADEILCTLQNLISEYRGDRENSENYGGAMEMAGLCMLLLDGSPRAARREVFAFPQK